MNSHKELLLSDNNFRREKELGQVPFAGGQSFSVIWVSSKIKNDQSPGIVILVDNRYASSTEMFFSRAAEASGLQNE